MLLVLAAIYLVTFPLSRRLKPLLCQLYRILGGIIVLAGSATSFYFAAYTGDQGGIAAFYFQIVVILVYVLFSIVLLAANWLMRRQELRSRQEAPSSKLAELKQAIEDAWEDLKACMDTAWNSLGNALKYVSSRFK